MTLKKRLLALCMAVVMVFSLCSISAFAAAPTDDKQPVVIGRYDAPLSECLEPGMAMQVGIANVRVNSYATYDKNDGIECFGKRWPVLHFLRHHDSVIKALDNGDKSHDSLEPKEKNRGFVRLNYGASQMNKKLEFFSSMAVAFIVLILVFLCIRFSGQGKFATHGGTNPSDVKCIYTSVWPDNEYTRLICEPESGTIEYILDGSNAGYYAIFYNNISEGGFGIRISVEKS